MAKQSPAPRSNIFLLTGENDFELKQFLKNWERSALEKYGEFNVVRFDFADREPYEIIGEIEAPPFFGDGKRVFFIENFPPPPTNRPVAEKKKTDMLALAEALGDIPEDCVVVLAVPNPDKRTAAYKAVSKCVGEVKEFPGWAREYSGALSREGEQEATEWIMQRVEAEGGKILPAAAKFLLEYCGADPWALSTEVDKLLLYSQVSGRPIAEADIKALFLPSDEMANFAFSNAFQSGKAAQVLEVFRQLMESGEAPQAIFNRDIVPTVRQLLQVRTALDEGLGAKEAGVHPFVFNKLTTVAKRFPLAKLLALHSALLTLDTDSKTGRLPITPEQTDLFRLRIERALLQLFGEAAQAA